MTDQPDKDIHVLIGDEETRRCPSCGGPGEDIVFRIDETADCYSCNWVGHEDDTLPENQK